MDRACHYAASPGPDWREILIAAFDLGSPSLLNVEWLMDAVERGEWGGLWW